MKRGVGIIVFCVFTASASFANPFLSGATEPKAPTAVLGSSAGPLATIQFQFRDKAGELLHVLRDRRNVHAFLLFLLVAFIYGMLHAAGPGHRKTIVFTLFLTRKSRWTEPIAAGFLSAGIHAGTGLALIATIYLAEHGAAALSRSDVIGTCIEGSTYGLLAVMGIVLVIVKIVHMARPKPLQASLVDPRYASMREFYSFLVIASLVPCPGAIMVMLFALYLDLPLYGVLGVVCMSVGMGIVVSLVGMLARLGRTALFAELKRHERVAGIVTDVLEIGSYLFIVLFSLLMGMPFFVSILSPL